MPKKKIVEEAQEAVNGFEKAENAERKTVSAVSLETPAEETTAVNSGEVLHGGGEIPPLREKNSPAEVYALVAEETHLDQPVPAIPISCFRNSGLATSLCVHNPIPR